MMLSLGPYRFTLNQQSLKRNSEYRWPALERVGKEPLLQGTGPGTDSIDLEGVIYSHFPGGLEQISSMRESAKSQKPYLLVDGQGSVLGHFVITKIEEIQRSFLPSGKPRKIEFCLSLKHYDNLSTNILSNDDVLRN